MALTELILGVGLVKLLDGTGSGSGSKEKPKDAAPNRDQGAAGGGVSVGSITGIVGSVVGIGAAIVSAVGGVGAAGTATAATTAAATGGTAAAGGGTAAGTGTAAGLTGGALVAATAAAVVIVVVWAVMVVASAFVMVDAASRRATRAALGREGVRRRYLFGLHKLEHEHATALIRGLGGDCTLEVVLEDGDQAYMRNISCSGLPADQVAVVATAARFLAVETFRQLNQSVMTYFERDFGHSSAGIASAGDALEAPFFSATVDQLYEKEMFPFARGEARSYADAAKLMSGSAATKLATAQARFNGKLLAIAYVQSVLAYGTAFPLGITQADVQAAAAASPPGGNQVAYLNRVFGLGEEQKASVLFDNEARQAWLPRLSTPTAPKMWPYETKEFITDSAVGY